MPDASTFQNVRPVVHVNGELKPLFESTVQEVTLKMPALGMASAEIRVGNWGNVADRGLGYLFEDLGLGDTLELTFGAAEEALFSGQVSGLEERYGEGAPQLVVLAEDGLRRLAQRRMSRTFEEQSVDDVVSTLASDNDLQADVEASSEACSLHQLNETDLAFLRRLLARYGIQPRVESGRLVAKPGQAAPEPVPLDANDTIKQARIVADLSRQTGKAIVRGHNPASGEDVEAEAERPSSEPEGTAAADLIGQVGWAEEETFDRPFPLSQDSADAFAKSAFDRRAERFLYGDLLCEGNPAIRVGGEVELSGVSDRLAGKYRVTECVHRFSCEDGYETLAKVEKADWQG